MTTRSTPDMGRSSKTSGLRLEIYIRARDLPRLIGIWPDALVGMDGPKHRRLVQKIAAALRRERQRGRAGHFAYDLARHQQLLRAYQAEKAAFTARPVLEPAGSLKADTSTVMPMSGGYRPG